MGDSSNYSLGGGGDSQEIINKLSKEGKMKREKWKGNYKFRFILGFLAGVKSSFGFWEFYGLLILFWTSFYDLDVIGWIFIKFALDALLRICFASWMLNAWTVTYGFWTQHLSIWTSLVIGWTLTSKTLWGGGL